MARSCSRFYVAGMSDDGELVSGIRAGDEKSLAEAMQRYFNPLARFAFTYLRDQAAAEDVAQDVFTRLWVQRNNRAPAQSLRAYLFGAARNRALDILKHDNVRSASREILIESVEMETEQHLPKNASERLEHEDDMAAMLKALHELPERRRAALRLRYIEGLAVSEVGAAMGIAPKAAEQLLIQAVKALRREIL